MVEDRENRELIDEETQQRRHQETKNAAIKAIFYSFEEFRETRGFSATTSIWSMFNQFLVFLKDKNKVSIIDNLKSALWKEELTFDDIKDLYLPWKWTLEQILKSKLEERFTKESKKAIVDSFLDQSIFLIENLKDTNWNNIFKNSDKSTFEKYCYKNFENLTSFKNALKQFLNSEDVNLSLENKKLFLKNLNVSNEAILKKFGGYDTTFENILEKSISSQSRDMVELVEWLLQLESTAYIDQIVGDLEDVSYHLRYWYDLNIWKVFDGTPLPKKEKSFFLNKSSLFPSGFNINKIFADKDNKKIILMNLIVLYKEYQKINSEQYESLKQLLVEWKSFNELTQDNQKILIDLVFQNSIENKLGLIKDLYNFESVSEMSQHVQDFLNPKKQDFFVNIWWETKKLRMSKNYFVTWNGFENPLDISDWKLWIDFSINKEESDEEFVDLIRKINWWIDDRLSNDSIIYIINFLAWVEKLKSEWFPDEVIEEANQIYLENASWVEKIRERFEKDLSSIRFKKNLWQKVWFDSNWYFSFDVDYLKQQTWVSVISNESWIFFKVDESDWYLSEDEFRNEFPEKYKILSSFVRLHSQHKRHYKCLFALWFWNWIDIWGKKFYWFDIVDLIIRREQLSQHFKNNLLDNFAEILSERWIDPTIITNTNDVFLYDKNFWESLERNLYGSSDDIAWGFDEENWIAESEQEIEFAQRYENFKKMWKDFEWDESAEFGEWAMLMIRVWESNFKWWWNNWGVLKINSISRPQSEYDKWSIEIRLWCSETWENYDIQTEFNDEHLRNILRQDPVYDSVIKMSDDYSVRKREFLDYVKNLSVKSDYKSLKSTKDKWINIQEKSSKFVNSTTWEEIKYVWKGHSEFDENGEQKPYGLLYKVEFNDNFVVVSDRNWWSKFNMTYPEFYVFCSDKSLNPYTQEQAETLNKKYWDSPRDKWWWNFYSVGAAIMSFKSIKDNFSQKWKRTEELASSKLYSQLLDNKLSHTFLKWQIFDELRNEAFSEFDSKIWSIISGYKDGLSRDWGVHDSKVVWVIESQVLKKKNIYKSNPLKAAAYFLYAVENGGWPYFRKLKKYAWQWVWVESILWPEHLDMFKTQYKALLDEASNNPSNWEILNKLARAEIEYVVDVTKEKTYKFGSNYGWKLESAMNNNLFSVGKSKEIYEDLSKKSDFSTVLDEYLWLMKGNMPAKQVWWLRALSEKIDDESQYWKWFMAMLLPILSWQSTYWWDANLKSEYLKIAWTNAFPMWMYINEMDWPGKVVKILDLVCEKRNITWKDKFSEFVWWDESHLYWEWFWSNYETMINKIISWWDKHWQEVIPLLNLENISQEDSIIKDISRLSNRESPTEEDKAKKSILEDYKEKIIDKWKDASFDQMDPNEAVQYKKAIFNMSPKVVEKTMLSFRGWQFQNLLGRWLWKILNWKLSSLLSQDDSETFEFVFSKYITWFADKHHPQKYELIHMFLKENKENLEDDIKTMLVSTFGWYYNLHADVEEWLSKFAKYFSKNINRMDNAKRKSFVKKTIWADAYEEYVSWDWRKKAKEIYSRAETQKRKMWWQVDEDLLLEQDLI